MSRRGYKTHAAWAYKGTRLKTVPRSLSSDKMLDTSGPFPTLVDRPKAERKMRKGAKGTRGFVTTFKHALSTKNLHVGAGESRRGLLIGTMGKTKNKVAGILPSSSLTKRGMAVYGGRLRSVSGGESYASVRKLGYAKTATKAASMVYAFVSRGSKKKNTTVKGVSKRGRGVGGTGRVKAHSRVSKKGKVGRVKTHSRKRRKR